VHCTDGAQCNNVTILRNWVSSDNSCDWTWISNFFELLINFFELHNYDAHRRLRFFCVSVCIDRRWKYLRGQLLLEASTVLRRQSLRTSCTPSCHLQRNEAMQQFIADKRPCPQQLSSVHRNQRGIGPGSLIYLYNIILNAVRCPYTYVGYVRASATLSVATLVANDVIMRMASQSWLVSIGDMWPRVATL